MNARIKRRLDALEAGGGGGTEAVDVVWIQRVAVGQEAASPTRARIGELVLLRAPGEDEAAFLGRVRVEALRQPRLGLSHMRAVTLDAPEP